LVSSEVYYWEPLSGIEIRSSSIHPGRVIVSKTGRIKYTNIGRNHNERLVCGESTTASDEQVVLSGRWIVVAKQYLAIRLYFS
jgi:hypothetical protein